jgi:AcrR family transcriptional regulator
MSKINQQTKEKILQAAELVFHENGFKGARTTAIARKANISRTMLHYYYRTKEDLFKEVLQNSFGHFVNYAQSLFEEKNDLKSLIEQMVDGLCDLFEEKPGMPSFFVNILNESPELITNLPFVKEEHLPKLFDVLIQKAIEKGTISTDMDGENLLINIYGLCTVPYLSAPLIQFKENRTDEEMKTFRAHRKQLIKTFIWKGLC